MASSGAGVVCFLFVVVLCSAVPGLATDYTVGDSSGWTTGVDYSTWTSGKTFKVGDKLVFNYGGSHSVNEVSSSEYNACSVGNPISTDSSGSTTITLKAAGAHYFICGTLGHCSSGMKLAVAVTAGGTTTTAPSGTSPPSGTTTTSPPPPRTGQESSSCGTLSPFAAMLVTWVALFMFVLS